MANTISSNYTLTNPDAKNLATTFRTAIQNIMTAESQPLQRVQTQRDALDVRKGVYSDLKNNFDALQTALKGLVSTQADYALTAGVKSSVTPATAGTTVLTANLTSQTALATSYDISVTQLAKAHSRASAAQPSADIALGLSGTFWMGGTGMAEMTFTPTASVTAAETSVIANGQKELGSGTYSVEIRESSGVKQFRIVNADGEAVSIKKSDGSGYAADWQTMTGGTVDTGRGFSVTINSAAGAGITSLEYTARGVSIEISASDTLRTIASSINNASQPEGRDFKASIVGKQLVFTANQTGENHSMIHTDLATIGLGNDAAAEQAAQNALFNVNGLSISRSKNSELTDVIDGVTLSLAGDAEGKSARVNLGSDYSKVNKAMETMVSKYNAAFNHLTQKMAITAKTEGDNTTYTRSSLTGDTVFRSLRSDMFNRMGRSYINSGGMHRLEEIGLTLDKDLKLTLDASKFEAAMKDSPDDVKALLDKAMGDMEKMVSTYTGSTGSLSYSITSMEDQAKSIERQISRYNSNLKLREASLINTYFDLQYTLAEWGNTASMLGIDISS